MTSWFEITDIDGKQAPYEKHSTIPVDDKKKG
jgi:hypothetical protein